MKNTPKRIRYKGQIYEAIQLREDWDVSWVDEAEGEDEIVGTLIDLVQDDAESWESLEDVEEEIKLLKKIVSRAKKKLESESEW